MKIEKLCDIYSYLKHVLEHGFDLSLDGVNSGFEPPSFRNWHIHKFWEVKIQSPENPKQKYLLTIVPPGVVHSMTKREMSLDITHHCVSVSVDSKNAIWQIFSNNDGGSCNLLPELLHVTTQYAALPEYRQLCTGLTGNILTNLLLLIKSNIENRKPARHVRDITKYALTYMNNCYFKVDLSITEIASFIGVTPQYLNKIIHKTTGMTTRKNLMEIRLKHARELLENSNYLVKEIATLTGWRSPFYFSNVFRAAYGISPNEVPRNTVNNLTVLLPPSAARKEPDE
ncbi:MAG: helix-turn-helix transcriptional regulator [Lentisphaeria bacterium]|nr:helix-turn-helix transcriptional regulator [Lentisphaeria bacterium]